MKETLWQYLRDEHTALNVGLLLAVILATGGLWKKYSAILWFPAIAATIVPTLVCILFTFAGGFGFFIWEFYWPFPIAVGLGLIFRPAFKGLPVWIGAVITLLLPIATAYSTRPGVREYTLQLVDLDKRPYSNAVLSFSTGGGGSHWRTGELTTDEHGRFTVYLYPRSHMTIGFKGMKQGIDLRPIPSGPDDSETVMVTSDEIQEIIDPNAASPLQVPYDRKP